MARTNKYTEARRKKGITTPYGQWLYPGKVTTIPDNKITMHGVPYPVLGISDKGDTKMMLPGMDYLFKGNEVTEYPLIGKAQLGNWLKETARKIIDSEARNAPSYSKDEISFANAFNDARNKGANKFYWDGKYYNTVKKEELDENNELKKDVYFPSYNIREKIKEFEGYKPNVYLDGNGIETIGYGFTDKDIVNKYRDTGITREAAEEIFNDYINSFVGELKGTPHFDELNQNQRDALLSYIYNIGSTNYFENSDLMQGALRDRNWEEVARQMDYGYNDKNNTGLRKRRDYEQKLFLTPVKQEGGYAPSYFLANQQMNVNKPDTASTSGIYASKWPTRDTAIANGVANGSSQQAFYEDMFHSLTDYMKEHGIEENVGRPTAYNIIAHHAMESSSGGRLPAAFNYGGIRLPGSTNYKKFDGIDNFIKDYMENTIGGRSVFEQAANGNAMSFEDYMKTLKKNGYFEADLDTYTRNAKNDGYMRAKQFLDDIPYQTGGEIHIKENNRGKFTEAAKRAGKSVQAYAAQILANKENYSPTLVKRANFARNARKWKHQEGGVPFEEWYKTVPAEKNDTTNYDLRTAYQYLPYSDMVKFANDKNFHLGSVVEMPGGDYVFLKRKDHPTIQKELDWYYGNTPEATEFRNNYDLDKSGDYYKYVKKRQIGKYLEGNYIQPNTIGSVMGAWNDQLAKGIAHGDTIANHVGTALNGMATAGAAIGAKFKPQKPQDDPKPLLYWPIEKDTIQEPSFNGYWGMETLGQGDNNMPLISDDNNMSLISDKFATGGSSSTPAEIERGEIVSTPTGDSIANGLMDYHELYDNQNEKKKNIVNLTNNMVKDVLHNPQLSSINERVNKYTAMRRNGKTFIFPSTVGTNGEILEPQVGANYWLAKLINKK